MVFFDLKEKTPDSSAKLVAGCEKYLSEHKGTVHFSVGVIAEEMARDVNDSEFDVALHMVFRNKAAHDAYQEHPRHHQFIEECSGLWKRVRVFDSHLTFVSRARDRDRPRRLPLPDRAARFSGLIRAKVVAKRDIGVVVHVGEIVRQWKHSKAEDAASLVGKRVLVRPFVEEGKPARSIVRYLSLLEVGDSVRLDVAHRQGESLTLLELDEEQRARVRAKPDKRD